MRIFRFYRSCNIFLLAKISRQAVEKSQPMEFFSEENSAAA
jgi:hypothetical protein